MNVRFCGNRSHSISDALKCIGSASDPAWELIVGGSSLWCSPLITSPPFYLGQYKTVYRGDLMIVTLAS